MRLKILRSLPLVLALPCFATTSIVSIDATPMQAKVTVQTDRSGNCTYRASRGTAFSTNLADLTDNGNTDARLGSLVDGSKHTFVLGTRKGADALAAGATYWVGVTCGTDAEVSKVFNTPPIPWGNLAPDPVPFHPARFGNMDYPVIDWSDQSKSYVDPLEGVEFWRLTSSALINPSAFTAQYNTTSSTPIDLNGTGKWSNLTKVAKNGTAYSTASGGPSDKVLLPLAPSLFYGSASGWSPGISVDDVLARVYCGNASQSGITLTLQFTLDGGQTTVGQPVTTSACPQNTPAAIGVYPQALPQPVFRGWGISSPQHNLVVPPSGTVSVANSVVTLQSPNGTGNYFVTEWVQGTAILINDTYYHVASVQSPTQLTITENPGTLNNVPYTGANAGVMIYKSAGGSVDVSVGLDVYGSAVPYGGTGGSAAMLNPVSVSVSKTADGQGVLNPPLKGYLGLLLASGGSGSIILWIPYNANGSVRNEVRLLSIGSKPGTSPRLHGAGDTFQYYAGVFLRDGATFDQVDGKSWFAIGGDNAHFFRATYDETATGCAGFPAYNPFPGSGGYDNSSAFAADDCFQWYNLTPATANPPMDLLSQMKRAYSTGLNSLGEHVGPAHPNFDLGWMGNPGSSLTDGGFFTAIMCNWPEHLCVHAAFDAQSGVLKSIKNTWGGDGDTEARWFGIHSISASAGTWRWATGNGLDDTNQPGAKVFNTSFDMPIVKVNRASAGMQPQWDSNTAISGTEKYVCPATVPSRYNGIVGTQNCIQVKVSTPPCSATPNSTYVFPDGKTEKDEFPCTTPGFGLANASRSKLMDMRAGDWLFPGAQPKGERFVILSVTYNAANDIDLWLLRWAGHNYIFPLFGVNDDYYPTYNAYPNNWYLSMAESFSPSGAASMAIDLSNPSGTWLPENPVKGSCHGVVGPGSAPGLYTYQQPCNPPNYRGYFDLPVTAGIFQPLLPTGAAYPAFADSANGVSLSFIQNYNNITWTFGAANPPYQLDFRHLNPSFGAGAEYLGSVLGNTRNLTLVPGTTKTYLTVDPLSAGPSDYKRLPLFGFAGHYLLKDVSGPSTGNTSDLPDYSVCRALFANECFAGSAAGNLYVSVPRAFVDNYCRSNQYTLPSPCAFQLAPYSGQLTQIRTDKTDSSGLTGRKLGYVHSMPGLKYQFSSCRATPDATFAFCVADWLDGVRSEWVALRLTPSPQPDSVNRTTFVPINVTYQGSLSASYIRARFGYAENGGTLLRCTAYQSECSTEIPAAAPNDPYSFTSESVVRRPCANGAVCRITIPAISSRMLYYVVDRLDSSGNIVTSYPMQVVPVP